MGTVNFEMTVGHQAVFDKMKPHLSEEEFEKFCNNYKNYANNHSDNCYLIDESPSDILAMAFDWYDSPERIFYWSNIHANLLDSEF